MRKQHQEPTITMKRNITMKSTSTLSFTCAGHYISGTIDATDGQWNFESQDPFFLQHFPFGIASYGQPGTQTDGKDLIVDSIKAIVAATSKDFQFS